jgi:hypothetical protein
MKQIKRDHVNFNKSRVVRYIGDDFQMGKNCRYTVCVIKNDGKNWYVPGRGVYPKKDFVETI